jgi:hypothetical protein
MRNDLYCIKIFRIKRGGGILLYSILKLYFYFIKYFFIHLKQLLHNYLYLYFFSRVRVCLVARSPAKHLIVYISYYISVRVEITSQKLKNL